MKVIFLLILSCVISAALIYSLGAFISWDVNPGNWDSSDRFFAGVFWLFGSYLVAFATFALTDR